MNLSNKSAMPPQDFKPYPPGANSIRTAAIITQNNQQELQNALTNNTKGGFKQKHRIIKGGATSPTTNASPVILVPSVPSGTVNPDATGENYKAISILAQQQAADAIYDTAQTSGDTALIQQQYKGGRRRRKGRKSRKSRKSRKGRKSRKSRKLKRH